VGQLCSAALVVSDNTAANLLLAAVGGPPAVTRFTRGLGDALTRLDRTEPALNEALPGDPRDTTTPRAMVADWRALLQGAVLASSSRTFLNDGLTRCETGTARIRAGIPKGWQAGDKTGSGSRGTSNDVAVLRPPHRAPIYVAAYLTGATVDADARDATLASVGRIVAGTFAR
jgi:beta-lactamase class A